MKATTCQTMRIFLLAHTEVVTHLDMIEEVQRGGPKAQTE